ncbi:MAG: nicotinate-nucleotide--dimethylbenzimidazole phosphoribosyltransferase, partial [Pseudomonas sp.]|uniref:nicotinate-nucleotide--dimethylbenzimidazole phosphoribosyltransferase n=1 Tax=Pseudomonas sp. TaxID=306 RepID=UPI003982006C
MSEQWWQQGCKALDIPARNKAGERQQQLTKPAGSLGQLEHLAVELAAMQGSQRPQVEQLWVSIFAGDHGVVAEGVSAFPQAVTGQMLRNFVSGGAAISVLAKQLGATLEVIDLGTAFPLEPLPGVRHLHIGAGTENFAQGPAMSSAQLLLALGAGQASVQRAREAGSQL